MVGSMKPGRLLARGVCRHLRDRDFTCIEEFVPVRGLRVDVMALGPKGEIWIVECKSSRADYMSDNKWRGYLDWCDRFFWAVEPEFPHDVLPTSSGLILADAYGAQIERLGDEKKLAPARRRNLTLKFARNAALRLHGVYDPGVTAVSVR